MQPDKPENRQQNQALKFIKAQFVVTCVLSLVLLGFDYTAAYSAMVGGLIATIANSWFAFKVFRGSTGADSQTTAETLLATFYVGEIYKFIFTGAMFVMAFVLIKPVNVIALLITYFLIHMTPAVVNVLASDISHSIRDKEK